MNENEISRIAAAISDLRPDWPAASIRSLLNRPELKNKPRRDVAVALVWVACEAETKTPARVIEAGPWWKAAMVESSGTTIAHTGKTVGRAANPNEVCGICDMWRDDCKGRADVNGHDFVPRSKCLPATEVGPLGERGKCLAGPPDAPCALITGHEGSHHCYPKLAAAPPPPAYLDARRNLGLAEDETTETEETEA